MGMCFSTAAVLQPSRARAAVWVRRRGGRARERFGMFAFVCAIVGSRSSRSRVVAAVVVVAAGNTVLGKTAACSETRRTGGRLQGWRWRRARGGFGGLQKLPEGLSASTALLCRFRVGRGSDLLSPTIHGHESLPIPIPVPVPDRRPCPRNLATSHTCKPSPSLFLRPMLLTVEAILRVRCMRH